MSAAQSRLPGGDLARGLAVTLRTMLRRSVTEQYPDVAPALPPRSRGVIALLEENCTVCMLCARECPDWCIYIDSHKEVVPAREEGARDRTRNVLDRFAIDYALCMYCGICVEVCPFDALFWSPEFEYSEHDITDLTHERDRLREWMWTVPPPPALDPDAEPAKEIAAAEKAAGPTRGTRRDPGAAADPAAGARPAAAGGPAAARPAAARPAAPRPAVAGAAGSAAVTAAADAGAADAGAAAPGGPAAGSTAVTDAADAGAANADGPATPAAGAPAAEPDDGDDAPDVPSEARQAGEADSSSAPPGGGPA